MQDIRVTTPAVPGGPVTATQTPAEAPRSREDLRAVIFRREEIWQQLNQAKARKSELLQEMRQTSRSDKQYQFLETRAGDLDARIARLEDEHYRLSDRVANAPSRLLTTTQTRAEPDRVAERVMEEIVPLTAIFSVFVLLPLTLTFVRIIWRRSSGPSQVALADQSLTAKRLEQIQQSVDAIAVEVERISEGQRYAAKMMDRALGAGAAEGVSVPEKVAASSYPSR